MLVGSVRTHVVVRSGNDKLGGLAATYRTMDSCPTDCSFYANGCYGTGRIFGIPRKYGTEANQGYAHVRALAQAVQAGKVTGVRFNVVGDYLQADGSPDRDYIAATNDVARELPRGQVIAYTHAWERLDPDWFAYPVNASCDTPADILRARAAGWQTVAGLPDASAYGQVIGGSRIVGCLDQTHGLSCADCMLCARERTATVGFIAHGTAVQRARRATQAMLPVIGPDGRIAYEPMR
jgi:hypothetical protein